ncbi:MAG: hypothetical protein NT071_09565, partial [Burkholderiales bacterium]|nr:hypothetical protein [Burkholderiales bacterium]
SGPSNANVNPDTGPPPADTTDPRSPAGSGRVRVMVSVSVVLANLATDIVHRLIDPRIDRT